MRTQTMKKAAAMAVGLAFVLVLGTGAALAKEKYEEKFSKTESLDRSGRVMISNVSGRVEVRSWGEAQVKIDAVKTSQADSLEKAKENAAKVAIEVTKTGNILRVETKYPDSKLFRHQSLHVSVDYVVLVPDKADVKVKNVSGSINVQDVGGPIEVDNTSGNVTVTKAGGGVDARTTSGTLVASDLVGDADLKTVSGRIKAERVKGSVSAETTSGSIDLVEVTEARTVRAKVLSGNIGYSGEVAAGGKYAFEALSGTITLSLPASASFDLDAETFSGGVQTDFPVTMSGAISRKEVRGTVGGGGATLRVKSFSGSIKIIKK
ncbi:MAG: DUF4097 domain-containing protein [Candidatus Aminicenantes bacterium]|nr:DUF4097 domain-containing protein [Candidatus Aminicenantes bacterium]